MQTDPKSTQDINNLEKPDLAKVNPDEEKAEILTNNLKQISIPENPPQDKKTKDESELLRF